jgi:cytochrome c oxidase assembly factor CtaG
MQLFFLSCLKFLTARFSFSFATFKVNDTSFTPLHRPATARLTYGMVRVEVFGALVSILIIWGMTFFLLYEAVRQPEPHSSTLPWFSLYWGFVFMFLCAGKFNN